MLPFSLSSNSVCMSLVKFGALGKSAVMQDCMRKLEKTKDQCRGLGEDFLQYKAAQMLRFTVRQGEHAGTRHTWFHSLCRRIKDCDQAEQLAGGVGGEGGSDLLHHKPVDPHVRQRLHQNPQSFSVL